MSYDILLLAVCLLTFHLVSGCAPVSGPDGTVLTTRGPDTTLGPDQTTTTVTGRTMTTDELGSTEGSTTTSMTTTTVTTTLTTTGMFK